MHQWRWSWLLLLPATAMAQPSLQPQALQPQASQRIAKARSAGRHFVIQFSHLPTSKELTGLTDRGYRIVQYKAEFAYVVLAPNTMVPGPGMIDIPAVRWTRSLKAEEKISAAFAVVADLNDRFALLEFYPDVDMSDARSIVVQTKGLRIQENPDLLNHHLLVEGTEDAIRRLADWDEIAYIFPAADELVQGLPMNACAGALTAQGQIGQSIAKVGGWGGPGLTGADLQYSFFSLTDKVPEDSAKGEIVRAFSEWARYAKLTFTPTEDSSANRTLSVLFGSRDHGDQYPFDGPGGILAHSFYPYPINPEPLAGNMHFDADENWHVGADIDLFSVALHETGHALGLGHSDRPGAVMYPYYRRVGALTPEDIGAVQSLYAAPDSGGGKLPLALIVKAPVSPTTEAYTSLTGSTTGGSGLVRVRWRNGQNASGTGTGSQSWSISMIPLNTGPNRITVTAEDNAQSQAVQTVTIERQPVLPPPSVPPASVPTLSITSPASGGTYTSAAATVTLWGLASADGGIARITWTSSRGTNGTATGTAAWTTGPIALDSGTTTITVTASSLAGTLASQALQVVYTPPTSTPPPPTPTPAPPPPPAPGTDTTPPSLTIVVPPSTYQATNSASILFSGTAKGNRPVANITWSTSGGDSGVATGTESWMAPAIPLFVGTNTVTIRAKDTAGNTSWRALTVVRK